MRSYHIIWDWGRLGMCGIFSGQFLRLLRSLLVLPLSYFFAASLSPVSVEAREIRYKDYLFEVRPGDRLVIAGAKGSVRLISRAPIESEKSPSKSTSSKASKAASKADRKADNAALEKAFTTRPLAGEGATLADPAANAVLRVRKVINDKLGSKGAEIFEHWGYTVRRDENVVRIETKGPESRTDWSSQIKDGTMPEIHFELEAPPVSVEVALRDGAIQARGWRNNLTLQIINGHVRLAQNLGVLRVQVQRGELQIEGHDGRLDVDGFNPHIRLAAIEGDLSLANFAGDSSIQDLKGNLSLKAFSGQTVANKIDGGVDFELGRASLNLQGLDGGLRGQLENGNVSAKFLSESDVNIESQAGSVVLNLSTKPAISVRLQTEDGTLNAPDELPISKTSTHKLVVGRLNGGGKGTVFVKSKTGNVTLR